MKPEQKQLPEWVQDPKWYYNEIPFAVGMAINDKLIDDSEAEAFALWVLENYWDRDEKWQKENLEDLVYDFHEQFLSSDGAVAYVEQLIDDCYSEVFATIDELPLSQYIHVDYHSIAEDMEANGEIVVLEGRFRNYVFGGNC